jgi:hypothetical protein
MSSRWEWGTLEIVPFALGAAFVVVRGDTVVRTGDLAVGRFEGEDVHCALEARDLKANTMLSESALVGIGDKQQRLTGGSGADGPNLSFWGSGSENEVGSYYGSVQQLPPGTELMTPTGVDVWVSELTSSSSFSSTRGSGIGMGSPCGLFGLVKGTVRLARVRFVGILLID